MAEVLDTSGQKTVSGQRRPVISW